MKHCGKIIKAELERKGVLQKDLAEFLGIRPQNIKSLLLSESIDSFRLERICEYLNLDPADFFDVRPYGEHKSILRDINQSQLFGSSSVTLSSNDAELMKQLLDEKEKRIENLEETVKLLKSLLSLNAPITSESADV